MKTKRDRVEYLIINHFSEWLKTREIVEDELSNKQSMFCICGRLATGLHERNCKQFQNKVTSETEKRLSKLII